MNYPPEPFRIKVVEPLQHVSRTEREHLLEKAGFNIFNIPAEKIYIDLLTDSGTSAMSDNQWAGMMLGDESYAQARNFFHLQQTVQEIFDIPIVIPTHQGRAAEHLLFSVLVKPGDVVPNNIHFDTTRANVEYLGAQALDCAVETAYDPDAPLPFKGNMDPQKLLDTIRRNKGKMPLVMMTITNNSGGGQPVSMENIRTISTICREHRIPFFFDAARFAENAFFIQQREAGYQNKSIAEIVRETFSYVDGFTMSAKKDALVNIGGMIGLRDETLARKVKELLILKEGFPTYGGLAGRDLEAMARGLREVLNPEYLNYRVGQVAYLGERLREIGVPMLVPFGGHAVYVNAKELASHIPPEQFPGQAIVIALYRLGAIRAVEIGSLMFGKRDASTGKWIGPRLELVRLAIPRRVYTQAHLDYVVETFRQIIEDTSILKPLKIVEEPPFLRHFTAKLEELS